MRNHSPRGTGILLPDELTGVCGQVTLTPLAGWGAALTSSLYDTRPARCYHASQVSALDLASNRLRGKTILGCPSYLEAHGGRDLLQPHPVPAEAMRGWECELA